MTSAALPSHAYTPSYLLQFLLRFAFHFEHRLSRNGFKMQQVHTMGSLFDEEKKFDKELKKLYRYYSRTLHTVTQKFLEIQL
jgi:hypothetical protein